MNRNAASFSFLASLRDEGSASLRPGLFAAAFALLLLVILFAPVHLGAIALPDPSGTSSTNRRLTAEISGSLPARDGGHLHLATELGNIVVHTGNTAKIDYRVHLEADASQPDAAELLKSFNVHAQEVTGGVFVKGETMTQHSSGRLWITFDVSVPRSYSVHMSTGGGNVSIEDLDGRAYLTTAGGNITAGNVGSSARLETDGGHIAVGNVAGELIATTGGGHINAGSIEGGATLHTAGGHIRVSSVKGIAHLETGGGNVTLEHSGADLLADTAGGQIEVGEASGLIHARTGGGGIRVVRMSGTTDLQTVGGSIYLTQVDGTVKASTGAGGITAWLAAPPNQLHHCEFHSSDGDIVLYIPRDLPVTIDAQIELGDEHRIFFDPTFPLKISYDTLPDGTRALRADGSINGGGEVLHLRTVAGNIRVVLSDTKKQIQIYKQQMDQLEQKIHSQFGALEPSQQPGKP